MTSSLAFMFSHTHTYTHVSCVRLSYVIRYDHNQVDCDGRRGFFFSSCGAVKLLHIRNCIGPYGAALLLHAPSSCSQDHPFVLSQLQLRNNTARGLILSAGAGLTALGTALRVENTLFESI